MAEADTLFQIEHIHNVTWTSPGALQLSIQDMASPHHGLFIVVFMLKRELYTYLYHFVLMIHLGTDL